MDHIHRFHADPTKKHKHAKDKGDDVQNFLHILHKGNCISRSLAYWTVDILTGRKLISRGKLGAKDAMNHDTIFSSIYICCGPFGRRRRELNVLGKQHENGLSSLLKGPTESIDKDADCLEGKRIFILGMGELACPLLNCYFWIVSGEPNASRSGSSIGDSEKNNYLSHFVGCWIIWRALGYLCRTFSASDISHSEHRSGISIQCAFQNQTSPTHDPLASYRVNRNFGWAWFNPRLKKKCWIHRQHETVLYLGKEQYRCTIKPGFLFRWEFFQTGPFRYHLSQNCD